MKFRYRLCASWLALLAGCSALQPDAPSAVSSQSLSAPEATAAMGSKFSPDPIAPVVTDPTPVAQAPVPEARCDFTVVLQNDVAFGFDRSDMTELARRTVDRDVLAALARCKSVELIKVTGYADRLGTKQYNQTLSEKRAEAVKNYLVAHGIASERISAEGRGSREPVTSRCKVDATRAELIACLAPDRRVVVEARGIAR